MEFNLNQKVFPSKVHEAIWNRRAVIIPIRYTIGILEDKELAESCEDFYYYTTAVFDDMYENPEIYFIDEETIKIFYNRIYFFQDFLIQLAYISILKEDKFVVSFDEYNNLLKTMGKNSHKRQYYDKNVKIKNLIDYLPRKGIKIKEENGSVIIENLLYPKMFRAVSELSKFTGFNQKYSGNVVFNTLDFRMLEPGYKKDYKDIECYLNDMGRDHLYWIYEYVRKHSLKSSATRFSFCYKYKGDSVLDVKHASAVLLIGIPLDWPESDFYNKFVTEIDKLKNADELKSFILKHLKYCTLCGPTCAKKGTPTKFLNKNVRLCRASIDAKCTSDEIFDMMKTLFEIKMNIIKST